MRLTDLTPCKFIFNFLLAFSIRAVFLKTLSTEAVPEISFLFHN